MNRQKLLLCLLFATCAAMACDSQAKNGARDGEIAGTEAGLREGAARGNEDGVARGEAAGEAMAVTRAREGRLWKPYAMPVVFALTSGASVGLVLQYLALLRLRRRGLHETLACCLIPGWRGSDAHKAFSRLRAIQLQAEEALRAAQSEHRTRDQRLKDLERLQRQVLIATDGLTELKTRRTLEMFTAAAAGIVADAATRIGVATGSRGGSVHEKHYCKRRQEDHMAIKAAAKDWTRLETLMARDRDAHAVVNTPVVEADVVDVPQERSGQSGGKLMPSLTDAEGIVLSYKAKGIRRETALRALKTVLDGQLEVLERHIKAQVLKHVSNIDLDVKEYLSALETRYIHLLTQFDIRNMEIRAHALKSLTDSYVSLAMELEAKDWPPSLIDETIAAVSTLRRRVSEQIMEDFPSRYIRRGDA